MAYKVFEQKVNRLAQKVQDRIISILHEDGKHIARFSSGVTIKGNTTSHRVAVEWGDGHISYAFI